MPLVEDARDPRTHEAWVMANIVIGADGSTTTNGRSAGLSSAMDRSRFHEIRRSAQAILIGGNTARTEPYSTSPKPLFVMSRQVSLPGKLALNDSAHLVNTGLFEAIAQIRSLGFSKILIEAGPTILLEALNLKLLDGVYVTQTKITPNENLLDVARFNVLLKEQDFVESEQEEFAEEYFSFYARLRL